MYSIVQWNCQGYSAKYEDLRSLLYDKNPDIATLLETMLGARVPRPPSGYCIYTDEPGRAVPGRGLAMLVKNGLPHTPINIQSPL